MNDLAYFASLPPFPLYDEYGISCDDRVQAHYHAEIARLQAQVADLADALRVFRAEAVVLSDDYLAAFSTWDDDATIQGWDKARWLRASAAAKVADDALAKVAR